LLQLLIKRKEKLSQDLKRDEIEAEDSGPDPEALLPQDLKFLFG